MKGPRRTRPPVAAAPTRVLGRHLLLGRARVSRGDGFRLPNGHSHETFGALNFTANLTAVQIVNRTREEIYNATRDFKLQRAESLSQGLDANETHVSEAVPLSQMGACHVPPEPEGDVDPYAQPFWPACAHVLGEGYDWGAPVAPPVRVRRRGRRGLVRRLEHLVILNAGGPGAPSAEGRTPRSVPGRVRFRRRWMRRGPRRAGTDQPFAAARRLQRRRGGFRQDGVGLEHTRRLRRPWTRRRTLDRAGPGDVAPRRRIGQHRVSRTRCYSARRRTATTDEPAICAMYPGRGDPAGIVEATDSRTTVQPIARPSRRGPSGFASRTVPRRRASGTRRSSAFRTPRARCT